MSGLPNEINDGPMIFPPLNVVRGQINQLSSTQSTTEQHGKDGTISAVPLKVEQIQLHTGLVVRKLVAEVGKPF